MSQLIRPGPGGELVAAAGALARLGLVTAFGHVSVRTGSRMLITPATDLAVVTPDDLLEVPLGATSLPAGCPAEGWLHLAMYAARPDVAAIARAQPPTCFGVAASVDTAMPLHGQAAWLGASIPVYPSANLLRSSALATAAVRSLPEGEALLLRGNGAVTVGATPALAVTRMWLLEAACRVWRDALATGTPTPMTDEEVVSWRTVADELLPRLWVHLQTRADSC